MPASLLSLPPELLAQIAFSVLAPPCHGDFYVAPPPERFTYVDGPSPAKSPSVQAIAIDNSHQIPRPTPRARAFSTPGLSSPSSRTRSCLLAALPRRSFNPHLTHTSISLLLVCRYLRAVATPIYYSRCAWVIGIQHRSPYTAVFRKFLNAIGPLARSHIRSITVVTSRGYDCFWKGPPKEWIPQLKRCGGLESVRVKMSWQWKEAIALRDDVWRQKCVDAWRNSGLQEIKHVAPHHPLHHRERIRWSAASNRDIEAILNRAFI